MTTTMLTPEQAQLSGHAQDAFHYALLASGDNSLSSFVGDQGTKNDALHDGFADSDKGLALYALSKAIHYARGLVFIPFRWMPSPKSRQTLAQVRAVAKALANEIRRVSIAAGWNAYNDALLADYPHHPEA